MTIRYLNSPVTGQGYFLFSVSNNTLPVFLSYVIFDDYKISKQPCDWTGGFSNFRKAGNVLLLTGNRKSPCPVTGLFRYLIVIKYNIAEKSR
jgi:hypothetical protein